MTIEGSFFKKPKPITRKSKKLETSKAALSGCRIE